MVSRQITINDLPVGRSVDETIRLLQAFQFTVRLSVLYVEIARNAVLQDKHGEVCPVGWTEGSKTIKADPKGSLDYFAAVDGDVEMQNGSSKKRARKD